MGCNLNFGTQSCPIELEAEDDEGKEPSHHNKGMDGLRPLLLKSTMKDSSCPTNLELVPYKKSSLSHHHAPSRSQESANPEPVSPSIQDMGPLRNADSGNESPGFAEVSLSLDVPTHVSLSPGATRSFKRLTKAHKLEHNNVVSCQKTELEREMELFEMGEREGEAHLLTSLRHNESNVCSTSPMSPNSVESIQTDWKRGSRGTFGEQPRPKRGQKRGTNHQDFVKEEDVCFACFDGGELILCDKRSCPKAYHMECTGRKSEFFRRKGLWYCGWHVCANCSRSANVHCYMCPRAFCSACTVEAEFLHVRKDRGLCELCYSIVYMIEHNLSINSEGVKVDFDDEETYEYLFRYYWKDLKQKISLTWAEISKAYRAKDEPLGKCGRDDKLADEEDRASTESDSRPVELPSQGFKRKRGIKNSAAEDASCSEYEDEEDKESDEEEVEMEEEEEEEAEEEEILSKPKRGRPSGRKFTGWASKELVDFLHSIKEDSKKPLTLILLNKLLLRYVEANRLISGYRGRIRCDERLQSLFGKKSVGKLQMMKLLTKHIASNRKASFSLSNYGDNLEVSKGNEKGQNQHKSRRKPDEVVQVQPDASSYASIDMKNISLIYLKRSLLEDLRRDPNFESKVTGAFVRIRVPSMVNKNDTCYRLVQIVGVKEAANPRINGKAAGVILEILNLHKREEITVDLVSSQDFTEDECQRLRQSIKCGLLKAITVGELQEKARVLREAKVKDWFDLELLRLSHLRDRASEKGRRKELRECVEKLQLLSNPSERQRQLRAPVQVTSDPCMDPNYESDKNGQSMLETQGLDNGSDRRRQWERSNLAVNHHNRLDYGGWAKVVSHSGAQAQGNLEDFEKNHRGHVSEKTGVGWGPTPYDDKRSGFNVVRKDDKGKTVIHSSSNCEDDGWVEKLHDNEKDIGRTGSADVKKSDGWAVESGSKENDGWEVNVGGTTSNEKWPGSNEFVEGWGKPETTGQGNAPEEDNWKQKLVNCETAVSDKKDSGWGGNGDQIVSDDGWDDNPVDIKGSQGWGSANNNHDGSELAERGWGGIGKDGGWAGSTGGNGKDDVWGGKARGSGKDNCWRGKAGGGSKDDCWGGNMGAHVKDDDKKGNTRVRCREDGGWIGKTCALKNDGGWEGNGISHKKEVDGWGGKGIAHKKDDDGWGVKGIGYKKDDDGWGGKGNTHKKDDDGWGGKGFTHYKDHDGWGGPAHAQSNDDGWGDEAVIKSGNDGWGHTAGSSGKDLERGLGNERGIGGGWGKVGGSRRDNDLGENVKGMERGSSWRTRSDGREGFDARPPYRNKSTGLDRREGFPGGDTRLLDRDNEGFGKTSRHANILPAQVRGVMRDVSTRSEVDSAGGTMKNEKEKIWYYQDLSKTVQGPFSMEQLRKWEKTKLFPLDLKVWRATEGQDASVLLTDALLGKCCNDLPPGFGYVQNSQGLGWGASEDIRNAPVPSSVPKQDNGSRPKWEIGNDKVTEKSHHRGSLEGARPCQSLGFERPSPHDIGRDGLRGHWHRETNHRDYLEHQYPHQRGNDSMFKTQKKDIPCRYFARGGCKKGDECDFRH